MASVERPITGDPLPDLKETPAFQQTLTMVGEVLNERYGVVPEQWPFLDPNFLVFLPNQDLIETQQRFSREQESVLVKTLMSLGVERELMSQGLSQPYFANRFHPKPVLYFSAEYFQNLNHPQKQKRIPPATDLGISLIGMNMLFLPDFRKLEGEVREYWEPILKARTFYALDYYCDSLSPEAQESRRDDIQVAKDNFRLILEGDESEGIKPDESLELLERGSQIWLMIDEGEGKKGLIAVGLDFHSRIASSLATIPQRMFINRLLDLLDLEGDNEEEMETLASLKRGNPRAYLYFTNKLREQQKSGALARLDEIKRSAKTSETEAFLNQLGLGDYRNAFDAYWQSRISEVYLERRRIQAKAAKKSGKPLKLADYPLD